VRKFVLLFLLYFAITAVFSYQWPSNKDYLSSVFGSFTGDNILDGIEFDSENQAIYPITDGEIVFYQDSFEFGDLDYNGEEGNILILKHVGEFKSIYRNFSTSDSFTQTKNLSKSELIGVSSGVYDSFIFSLYDDKKDSYINPQQILPFLLDDRKPVISSVYIDNLETRGKLTRNISLNPGLSRIYIDAWDVVRIRGKYKKFTPFSVNVFVDGFERYNTSFSSLKEIDKTIYLSGNSDVPLKDIISGGTLLYGGDVYLTTGSSLIEIVIKDIEGNEASRSYPVVVK